MSFPRIFIKVDDDSDGRWAVRVTAAEDGHEFDRYHMDSIVVDVDDQEVRVPVVPSSRLPGPETEHRALSTGDTAAISKMLGSLASNSQQPGDVRVYGRWLFECLLAPAWPAILGYPAVTAARGVELALWWPATQASLHSLVWEAMYSGEVPLAGLTDTLVVVTRVVQSDHPAPATITRVPKVLFATGSSLTDDVIRPGAMFMGLLRKFDADGICVTRAVHDVSLSDLETECRTFQPDVVHLVAHGEPLNGDTVLQLGSQNVGTGVSAGQLRQALTAGGVPMSVVLSACHSGGGLTSPGQAAGTAADAAADSVTWRAAPMAAQLVAGGIPIVTAMAGAVSEPACRMYTTRLVDAIHQGKPLARAAAEGRAAALTGTATPSQQLDWAMPTIFLSSAVQPEFRPLDPAAVDRVIGVADSLNLRQKPVFIGRHRILATVDDLFSEEKDRRTGFLAIGRDGALDRLGSTRLLQEIGFRLLRTGHVPLLLGEHSEASIGDVTSGVPMSLRAFLAEVLQQAVQVTMEFNLPPPRLSSLEADPSLATADAVTGAGADGQDLGDAYGKAWEAIHAFAGGTAALDNLKLVRYRLAKDLASLADIMAGAGEPFGSRTRVVVLADRVHQWKGALGPLLKMIDGHGLGQTDRAAPVIVTSSLTSGDGPDLSKFLHDKFATPGVRSLELTTLSSEEAALGFQWVLLNPWHPLPKYYRVYAAARSTRQCQAQAILNSCDGEPASVRWLLYKIIESHTVTGEFVDHDDEAAIKHYEELHP